MQLNLGCGEFKLKGFINIDCEPSTDPDLLLDFCKEPLPYGDESIDKVWMVHCLEHIEYYKWEDLVNEIKRVLKPNGELLLSYPEFWECAKRFVDDDDNKKDFWRNTLYGRQLYPSDYHVTPMHSKYIKPFLESLGFYRVSFRPESPESQFNTILVALKDPEPTSRELVIARELHL